MSVDQQRKRRFCGYCNRDQVATWSEMETHLDLCEELEVARFKLKGKDDPKDPPKEVS